MSRLADDAKLRRHLLRSLLPVQLYQFDAFELDCARFELRRDGKALKLERIPLELLILLAEKKGEVVTRQEIIDRLWGKDVFVDTDHSINTAIRKVRTALRDGAERPRYIQTISGKGYRFVAEWKKEEAAGGITPASGTSAAVAAQPKRRGWVVALPAVALLVILAVGFGAYERSNRHGPPPLNLQNMRLSKLTESGRAANAALSPDGRYVAYTEVDGEKQSLWIHQVASGSEVQVLPPDEVSFEGATFSPDGNYIYFTRWDRPSSDGNLYAMPVLGGKPRPLVRDIDTPISFSPDGKEFVFMRGDPIHGEYHIVIANTMTGKEKDLATRKTPLHFEYVGPAWSPDGKTIAASAVDYSNGAHWSILAISVADGSSREIYRSESKIGRLRWLPDGGGLVTVLANPAALPRLPAMGGQIWYISYPAGEARRLTNDLMNYALCCLDLTRDGGTITDVQNTIVSNLWIASGSTPATAVQITSGEPVVFRQTWMPDGETVIYHTLKGNLRSVRSDGSASTLLTPNQHNNLNAPSVCGDGRYLVYESLQDGYNIWRMEPDGSKPTRLTNGKLDDGPICSPDGKWVLYFSEQSGGISLWRVPIDGGKPTQLTQELSLGGDISPDGRLVSYYTFEGQSPRTRWVVISGEDGKRFYSFDVPLSANLLEPQWAPDGSGLDYISTRSGVSNIWRQPLSGGQHKQITHFSSGHIFGFGWSRGGKRLSVARGDWSSDVILISNFR